MLRWRWTAAVVVRVPAAAVSHAGRVPGPRIHRSEKRSNQGEIRPAGRSDPRSMTRQEESGVGCSNWGKNSGAVSVVFPCFGEFVGRGGPVRGFGGSVAPSPARDELELDDRLGQR